MANASRAGPFRIGLDSDLQPDERRTFGFEGIEGPEGKEGGLQKFYGARRGMDFIYVTNTSEELISAIPTGGGSVPVAPATSINLEGSAQRRVTIVNQSSNVITASDVTVNVGNEEREGEEPATFSTSGALADLIPGVR